MRRAIAIGMMTVTVLCAANMNEAYGEDGKARRGIEREHPGRRAHFALPTISGRHLFTDDGDRFIIRGFGYSPTPICQYPGGDTFDTYTEPRLPRRDARWIRSAGGNVLRIYGALFTDGASDWTIGTTRKYLRELEKQGIWVVMGTEIQPESCLSTPDRCSNIIRAHVDLVRAFRGVRNILMWAPGNEVNSHISDADVDAWYDLLDRIARAIKTEQGGVGPGEGPYVCGILGEFDGADNPRYVLQHNLDDRAPDIDIWSINTFRGSTLGTLFEDIERATQKPFWIAEMGIDSFDHGTMQNDEIAQANYAKALWMQIETHCDVVTGADIAFYSDEWWKYVQGNWNPPIDPDPCVHNPSGGMFGCAPDNLTDEEYLGAMRISEGCDMIDSVSPKRVYYAAAHQWANPPDMCGGAPFLADFNAPDCNGQFSNNYAGTVFPVGNVRFEPAPGASGSPGDWALHAQGETVVRPALFVATLFPAIARCGESDLGSSDHLSFHARLGTPTGHRMWEVRVEDCAHTALCGWQIEVSSTDFEQFCFDASACKMDQVAQIVFDAVGVEPPETFKVDLVVDNLAIFPASDEQDGDCIPDTIDNCPHDDNPDQQDSDSNGIADACEVQAIFEPPITNRNVCLRKGRRVPIRFHLENAGGTPIREEQGIQLDVRGPSTGGGIVKYTFALADGTLRFDKEDHSPHYITMFGSRKCPLLNGAEYTAFVSMDGVSIGSTAFVLSSNHHDKDGDDRGKDEHHGNDGTDCP